jgi:hypothetical protein
VGPNPYGRSNGDVNGVHDRTLTFFFHDTDTIVGLEMTGEWMIENEMIRLVPETIKVRGKPDTVPKEWVTGFNQRV